MNTLTLVALVAALPWLAFPMLVAWRVRRRPLLDDHAPLQGAAPRVSIVVPARNEAETIATCVRSLTATTYANWEVVVIDDGSEDGTAALARDAAGGDPRVRVLAAEPLPDGWYGKPWACEHGASATDGEWILFTDADVEHAPELVGRAVAAGEAAGASLVSVLPRQVLGGFWERLVMPHVLFLILLRYPDPERVNRSPWTRDKIANGQFILVRRDAYRRVGGHGAVRGEVVEDLRLAQRFHECGERVYLAVADRFMSVRMYRSLGAIVEGWSKNVAAGARHAVPARLEPFVPWLLVAWLVVLWLVPPAALLVSVVASASGGSLGAVGLWALTACAASLVLWIVVLGRLGVWRGYAPLYPFGGAVAAIIFLRSAVRGERVTWKGRNYLSATGGRASDPGTGGGRPSAPVETSNSQTISQR
jgi:chlorobactene glucosyltransferase